MSGLEVQILEGLQLPPSSTTYGALTKEERAQREAQGGRRFTLHAYFPESSTRIPS